MTRDESKLATGFWASSTKALSRGRRVRRPLRDYSRQVKYGGRLFTWPADQPRHATYTSSYPVESSSPPGVVAWPIIDRRSRRTLTGPFPFYRIVWGDGIVDGVGFLPFLLCLGKKHGASRRLVSFRSSGGLARGLPPFQRVCTSRRNTASGPVRATGPATRDSLGQRRTRR